MRKMTLFLLILAMLIPAASGEEEESFFVMPAQEEISASAPAALQVSGAVKISAPLEGASYDVGGKLRVKASAEGAVRMEALLAYDGGELKENADGDAMDFSFNTELFTHSSLLTVTAFFADGTEKQTQQNILSPRDKLFADMFALAEKNSKDSYYRHAPAQTDTDRGVCKNFVMRLFDTFSDAYAMAEYPGLTLHMPKNKSKKDSAPYQYGIEWRDETAEDGSPFYIAAQYKYDQDLTKEENVEKCREVLKSIQRGDFFQMCGDYYYGNGPHSLLFMSDYDAETDLLHWTDSNMKGDRVDGARWGYLQYDAVKEAEWFVEAISKKSTYKTRGCTIYRLRDDLFIK